ncbi:MAG: glycine zipper 2TM domain-containing protein [Deltaproteobacteria bacterium]|nr:glycine zipper 2TM domain-containing protein [Deltaproteobacteria bacterium]
MKRIAAVVAVAGWIVAGCAGGQREQVGTVLGGAAGGILGSQVGGGHGRTVGIIVGTLLGAIVGQDIGRSLDEADELRAAHVLEKNRTGQPSTWENPDKGTEVTVTPVKTYQAPSGQYCREYQTEVTVGGKVEQAYGTACRQPDGQWKIVR